MQFESAKPVEIELVAKFPGGNIAPVTLGTATVSIPLQLVQLGTAGEYTGKVTAVDVRVAIKHLLQDAADAIAEED